MANPIGVPNYKLLLNDNELPVELRTAVEAVTFEDELNLPGMFVIKLNIIDFENGNWRGVDLNAFKPGDPFELWIGIDNTLRMISGEITSLELTLEEHSFMEICGYDRLHRLRFGKKRRSFKDTSDSDLAATIAGEYGLAAQVEDSGVVHPYLFQNNQSNYEFLYERAQQIDYEMLVDDRDFYFRRPQLDSAPVLTLRYKLDFDSLSIQIRTLTEGSTVEVRGWSVNDKSVITASATDGSENSIMSGRESGFGLSKQEFGESAVAVIDKKVLDANEAETIAKAKYNALLKEFVTGECKCNGDPRLRTGKTVEITGIGQRFSGIYYIVSTTHSINRDEGYKTSFKIRRTGI